MNAQGNILHLIVDADIVDKIGALKAQIAPLETMLGQYQDELKRRGNRTYEGDNYDATVFVQHRSKLDLEKVREKLSQQFLRAHTKLFSVVIVKVTAKQLKIAA